MKKIVSLSLLLSMFLLNSFAQTKEEITGSWTITKVTPAPNMPEDVKKGFDKLEKMVHNSTLQFDQDGKCEASMLEAFSKEAGAGVGKTTWVFNEIDKSVLIHEGSGKNQELLMKLYVRKEGKKIYLIGDELFIRMDLKKNKK